MANTYKSKLDIKTVKPDFKPVFVQHNHARLEIKLMDNRLPYDLSMVDRVEFTHERPDKTIIIHPGEIVNGIICYTYRGSEMDILGKVQTSLAVIDADNKTVSSHPFIVEIKENQRDKPFNPAEPNFGLLQTLIKDIEDLKENGGGGAGGGKDGYTPVKGVDYVDGKDGKTWHVTASTPSNTLGAIGDMHLNTATFDIREKTATTAWTVRGNIKGPSGGGEVTLPQHLTSNAVLRTKESSFAFVEETGVQPTAYITLTDDDGDPAVWTKLKPISEEKGVPFVLALYGESPLPDEQGLYLQNELGWEITSHTYMHEPLPTFTGQALDDELALSKRHLTDKGYNVTNIIYPYGQINEESRNAAAKYFNCGAIVGAARTSSGSTDVTRVGLNMQPVAPFDLGRVALGSFAEGNNTLAYYKTMVDNAVRDGSWLIFMMHCGHPEHDETQQQHLRDIIDYIHSLKAKIVTMEEGNQLFGNKIYASKKTDTNNAENLFAVTNDGKLFLEDGQLQKTAMIRLSHNAFSAAEPITSYPNNMVSSFSVSGTNATGFPDNTGGTVTTSRIGGDIGGAFNFQEYTQILTNKTFKRFWNIGLNGWDEFDEFAMVSGGNSSGGGDSVMVIVPINTYTVASPITAYANNKVTISTVNFAGAVGFPNNRPGTFTTYRIGGDGWDYQEYKEYGNHNKYIRYVDAEGSWSEFGQYTMAAT